MNRHDRRAAERRIRAASRTSARFAAAMKDAVRRAVPESAGIASEELDALVGLLSMASNVVGDEDPRVLAGRLSDRVLDSLCAKSLSPSSALAPVAGFLQVEAARRRGELEEDWRWEWTSASEGRILFKLRPPAPEEPLSAEASEALEALEALEAGLRSGREEAPVRPGGPAQCADD